MARLRIGHGYDVHRFALERPLILGGVHIPYEMGLLGHSDADVLAHAVMDAVFGALGLGDIGVHFPDSDELYRGADSMHLLHRCVLMMRAEGYQLSNLDATIVAQVPKLAPYLPGMQENIARLFDTAPGYVNIKATTEEGLGFTGAREGIAAHCVCLLEQL